MEQPVTVAIIVLGLALRRPRRSLPVKSASKGAQP